MFGIAGDSSSLSFRTCYFVFTIPSPLFQILRFVPLYHMSCFVLIVLNSSFRLRCSISAIVPFNFRSVVVLNSLVVSVVVPFVSDPSFPPNCFKFAVSAASYPPLSPLFQIRRCVPVVLYLMFFLRTILPLGQLVPIRFVLDMIYFQDNSSPAVSSRSFHILAFPILNNFILDVSIPR